jgi:hypothetical protein
MPRGHKKKNFKIFENEDDLDIMGLVYQKVFVIHFVNNLLVPLFAALKTTIVHTVQSFFLYINSTDT